MPDLVINLTSPPVIRETITQNAHGFVVGDVLRCDNTVANTYVKALADTEDNAKAVGVVNQVVNANEFVLTFAGRILSGVPAQAQGSVMYLSDSVAGAMTTTAPTIKVRIMEISENAVSGIVNIDWSGGTSGSGFIPLAGTDPGSPVTGNIEIQNTGPATTNIVPQATGVSISHSDGLGISSYLEASNDTAFALVGDGISSAIHAVEDSFRTKSETNGPTGIGNLTTEEGHVNISADNLTEKTEIDFTGTEGLVTSTNPVFEGLKYAADYSPNFVNRSLVDKEYVDTAVGPAVVPIVSITRAALQALLAGSTADTTVIYRVTDAVGSTLVLDVFATANNAISGLALDQTNLRYLFYNISGDAVIDLYIPAIASVAQGDIAFYNGSAWTRLAAGTSINNLRTGGTGANPAWGLPIPCVDAGGTADAITATYTPAATLQDNLIVAVVAGAANTVTNPTFAPNGLTAHTIVKQGGQALIAGDIPGAEYVALLRYDLGNTRWELLNPAARVSGVVDWTSGAAVVGFSALTTNSVTYSYNPLTKMCSVFYTFIGTSDNTALTFTLPFTSAAIITDNLATGVTNNGATSTTPGRINIPSGSTTCTVTRDRVSTAWTASGGKTAFGQFTYLTA